MQILRLNCASCGAPISVPEDLDTLFCTSCGSKLAVDRGDGYITLKLVEKIAKAIEESGDRAHSAITENTYVTKVELKRVQISQSMNTEEIKLNSVRQEIRGLVRKPQLLPVEQEQLVALRIEECDSLLRIRKLNMDSAKLEPGWEESMEVFQADLACVNEIIKVLTPNTIYPKVHARLNELIEEKQSCEKKLVDLETLLVSRQLKSLRFAPINTLSVEELEAMQADIQSDMNLLVSPPQTPVKIQLRNEISGLSTNLSDIYPRLKVEAAAGKLESLDLQPPYPEIPWELIPLIDLAAADLEKVQQSPDNPSKFLIKTRIEKTLNELKLRQAMDIPTQRVLAAQRRKRRRKAAWIALFCLAVLFGLGIFLLNEHAIKISRETEQVINSSDAAIQSNAQKQTANYEEVAANFFEIIAQKTYLRPEPDINSQEFQEVRRGDILLNLGASANAADWFQVQSLDTQTKGYLYEQWLSPVEGQSFNAQETNMDGDLYYSESFLSDKHDWVEDSFNDDFGQGEFKVENGKYIVTIKAIEAGYLYSKVNLGRLPDNYLVSAVTALVSSDGLSASGLVTNYVDADNFDYFLLTSEGYLVVGCRRNGKSATIYNTQTNPNKNLNFHKNQANQLGVLVETGNPEWTDTFTYILNGQKAYTLKYSYEQDFSPVVGVIVWSMQDNLAATFTFTDIKVIKK